MIKKLFAVAALSVGVPALCAPIAQADPPTAGYSEFQLDYVTPFSPGAFGNNGSKPMVLTPWLTTPIECAQFHGSTQCSQVDPWGNAHPMFRVLTEPRQLWLYQLHTVY